ncbi:hypothetical protein ACWGDE_07655 [Streptomyces sp. NPDC054956]
MGTPEEIISQGVAGAAQGVAEGFVAPAGDRIRARGAEKDRRRADAYDRQMKDHDERRREIAERREAFNAVIRAARGAYSLWCERDTRESQVDTDPFFVPEEIMFDPEEQSIQNARYAYGEYRGALKKLDEALDALVNWYTVLSHPAEPTRQDLETLIRSTEQVRDQG